jgi:hypothetical protein
MTTNKGLQQALHLKAYKLYKKAELAFKDLTDEHPRYAMFKRQLLIIEQAVSLIGGSESRFRKFGRAVDQLLRDLKKEGA